MSTFCRITGKSRGLPKPNYFPLLPPISPADAKRFCRVTGKSYGLPAHHYIPVLVSTKPKKKAAQAPIPTLGQQNGLLTNGHMLVADYRYVFPVCEDSNDLVQLLDSKNIISNAHYIYKVDERKCSLVFTAKMEAAVRDGDIKNVMLAKDSDTLLLKLRKGGDVAIDVKDINIDGLEIYDGEGPSEEVVNERKKRKRKGPSVMSTVGKIFEDKERAAELAEEKENINPKLMKKETKKMKTKPVDSKPQKWNEFKPDPVDSIVPVKSGEMSALFENNDWSDWEKNKQHKGHPITNQMPTPSVIEPQVVDLGTSLPGLIQAPLVLEHTAGLEVTSAISPLIPLVVEPDPQITTAIKEIDSTQLVKTAGTEKIFAKDEYNLNLLPTISEIPELLQKIKEGTHSTVGNSEASVNGLKVDIKSATKFVVGLTVSTPTGDVFVPGQTVSTPNGDQFVPGITVKTPDGVSQLLPGQIIDVDQDNTGVKQPTFVVGQVLNTRNGEQFVQGQKVITKDGVKFVPGQTVFSDETLKFIPGQVIIGENPNDKSFVAGMTELDCEGHKFVPGQMHADQHGRVVFTAGQCDFTEEGWKFVPGQNMVSTNGELKFVPGQTVESKDGPTFIPGQTITDKFGESTFVPGVVVEAEEGPKFLPGASIKTSEGQQFVEGQLFRSGSGKVHFIPGHTDVSDEGDFKFAAANTVADIVYRDSMSLGISIENAAINTTDKSDTIYGHIVQTIQGVEFFPGGATGLPAGKVVPGRLVRGKEVKFVPGILIDDKFVPGQVVTTDTGEQFVPGQVVETKDGPKFVPGQIVDTRAGPKFVPGQTVETADGPKFVPGQIVETKAGPTFIPGQVISTDDEGSKFVPGQVVETIEGPRFVPGRVIESGNKVSFIPGQVVETSEGLKFVAPDLENDPEGDIQFTVQGFEITPEELNLLHPQTNNNSIFAPTSGETAIDSRMMRQLSEAGMAIGRQVPADVPAVDVRIMPAMGMACSLRDRLPGFVDPVTTVKLSQILAAVASFDNTIQLNGTEIVDNAKEGIIVKSLMKAASLAGSEIDMFRNLGAVLEKVLLTEGKEELVPIVDKLHKFVTTSPVLEPMRPKKKMVILKDVIVGNSNNQETIVDKLSYILNDCDESILEGFKNFSKGNPEIVGKIVQRMTDYLDKIETEKDASDALQKAIRDVVRESSEISVQDVLNNSTGEHVKNMFLEAIGLAKAMGMRDVANTLLDAIEDPQKADLLVNDRVTFEILRRLTVMRHLAVKRPKFGIALDQLKTDPVEARGDPLVRELVRESGALMIVPEETSNIHSAGDVPMSLLVNNNSLAMEDFMLRNKTRGILVIVCHGFQCVIPREASRAVLTGKVPYTVLDEKGMHTFAPMHVFSALHIPKMYTHRFSMYSVKEEEQPTLCSLTPVSGTSTEDLRTQPSSVDT